MSKRRSTGFNLSALLGLLLTTSSAFSTTIEYSVDALGGSSYRYNYTVINDSLATGIDNFAIYFDSALYDNLAVAGSPVAWDSLVLQPDLGLPADGVFDALALGSSLAVGASLAGFSVEFEWLDLLGMPGAQMFEVIDANFDVIDSGSTSPVPLPASFLLLASAFLGLRFLKS